MGGILLDASKPHDVAREELSKTALELGEAVSLMVTSALKKEAAALAKAAGLFIFLVYLFVAYLFRYC